ncbi:hypothetical protein CK203_061249 [Vitis vinifera]|uniref:Uncharacterized protein n=1 Tax=Vitis vinifera TaxID=29760 RepID=A0A438G5E8_VITVI|nr:hypothetical protein CK203_061249 [Vitis vinifera]
MENTAANQLPEVDSLPDGFVESSAEPVAPPTPTLDKESDYKDSNFSTTEPSNDLENESLELLDSNVDRVEKTQKPRTFPVPLSEKDGFDSSGESPKVTNKGCSEPGEATEGGSDAPTTHLKDVSSSESIEHLKNRKLSVVEMLATTHWGFGALTRGKSLCGQLKIGGMLMDHNGTLLRAFFKHIEVDLVNKAEILALLEDLKLVKAKGLSNPSRKGESCSSPIFGKIRREAHGILMKDMLAKRGGNQSISFETSEVKRKSAKRTFKSEKEFLEFSLKYQQVIAERDTGK